MTTKPTAPSRASRHPYSTRGLSLRLLLLGAMLTSLAIAVAGAQPVGAVSDGREPASGAAGLADGGPRGGPATGGPTSGEPAQGTLGGQASGSAPAGGDGGVMPAASVSPSPGGGSAGGPSDDWHRYHHWTDPSWPDPGQAIGEGLDPRVDRPGGSAPLPARTAGGYEWELPVTPTTEPTPSTGWTPTPDDTTDPPAVTPTGSPTPSGQVPDPTTPDQEPTSPTVPATSATPPRRTQVPPVTPGQVQPDGSRNGALPQPSTSDPLSRDPVAAGPDDEDLGLGETVDEPTPTPEPSATTRALARPRVEPADPAPTAEYQDTLIYSGLIGLALAAVGFTMVTLRRRRW